MQLAYTEVELGLLSPKCPSCAASIDFPPHAAQTRCAYCGNQVLRKRTMLPKVLRREPVAPPPVHQSSRPALTVRSNHSPVFWLLILAPLFIVVPIIVRQVYLAKSLLGGNLSAGSEVSAPAAERVRVDASVATEAEPQTAAAVEPTEAPKRKPKRKHRRGHKRAKEPEATVPDEAGDAPSLTKAAARRVFRSVHMLHCGGTGDLTVHVKIAASGKVTSVSSKGQDEVASCVADTVDALRFPASASGLTTSHRYHW